MRREIHAVHKQKLEEFLRNLELWEPLQREELRCAICGNVISLNNIGFIIPSGNEILFCCASTDCIERIHRPQAEESDNDN